MDDLTSFENYCIVCDRLIVAPAEPNPVDPVAKPKKKAQGAIRIKNPDGTTTTRTASGVKTTTTTRPTLNLRRTNSAVRLAGQPPQGGEKKRSSSGSSGGNSGNEGGAPPSPLPMSPIDKPPATATTPNPAEAPASPPFVSNIYCSQECQDKDAVSAPAAYEDMARAFGLGITTSDTMGSFGIRASPVGPPSPLLGSDTDTNSSTSASIAATMLAPRLLGGSPNDGYPAASAPKTMEYFRIGRDLPDEVWADLERQRRKSISNGQAKTGTAGIQLLQMTRQRSGQSQSGTSSDSLSSLWHGNTDEVAVHRPSSGNGVLRGFTAAHPGVHRSMSAASVEASAGTPPALAAGVRPIPRSALSQTSLGGLPSPGPGTFAEVGSAPSHTAFLMQAYASNFPNRDGTTPSVYSGASTPNIDSGRNSIGGGAPLQRPSSGTIRARARTNSGAATWDSLGRAEVIERSRRSRMDSTGSEMDFESPVSPEMARGRSSSVAFDITPKQSLEIENGSWQIRYAAPTAKYATTRAASRSRSRSRPRRGSSSPTEPPIVEGQPTTSHSAALALPIPSRATRASAAVLASSNSTARARTPQQSARSLRTPPVLSSSTRLRTSYTALPDLAALRIGSTGCATTYVSPDLASSAPSRSAPRPGFDWDGKSNHLTYELPNGVVANPNKGLFYFNA